MKAIKFLKAYDPYEPGHVVDLDDKIADTLIEKGIARFYRTSLPATVVTTSNTAEEGGK